MGIAKPDQVLKMPSGENHQLTSLPEEEIFGSLKSCDYAVVPAATRNEYKFRLSNAIRNKAIILTLLDAGIRVGELTRLRKCDVNLENEERDLHQIPSCKEITLTNPLSW